MGYEEDIEIDYEVYDLEEVVCAGIELESVSVCCSSEAEAVVRSEDEESWDRSFSGVSVGHETPSYPLDVEYRTVDGVELVETVESVEGIWVAQRHWWGVSATLVCKSSEKLDIPDKRRRLFERSRGAIARLERVEGRWGGIVKKQHSNVRRMSGSTRPGGRNTISVWRRNNY